MPAQGDSEWLTTAEAAALLGVKPQTLYAYVSRGQLMRRRDGDGHGSHFRRSDIEQLAGRGSRRSREGTVDVVIDSELTLLEPDGRLFYRGEDVVALASSRSFEEVAEWLWAGRWPTATAWRPRPGQLEVAAGAQAVLAPGVTPIHRLRLAVPALGAADPDRHDLAESSVVDTARALISAVVESLPVLTPPMPSNPPSRRGSRSTPPEPAGASPDASIASKLWPRLCERTPEPGEIELLNAALVLMADHELPASTLVARATASMLGHPYLVVSAALGTLGGTLHGGASVLVEDLLRSLPDPATATEVVGARLANHERISGFGHAVYRHGDPRCEALLDRLQDRYPDSEALATAMAVARTVANRGGPAANVDLGLAALVVTTGMVRGAGEAITALSRSAGWIAHAIEEYRHRSRFRLRAVYTGPRPA